MRSCFVSAPVGVKSEPNGRLLDFDFIYAEVLRPAVEAAGMQCHRLDDFSPNVVWHKTLFAALVSSDLVIADISTNSPNVFYEIGVRHALKRGRTIFMSSKGGRPPADISYMQVLSYEPDASGRLTGQPAERFRAALHFAIRQSERSLVTDSPIFELFPDLEVILPHELEASPRERQSRTGRLQRVRTPKPVEAAAELDKSRTEIHADPDSAPYKHLSLMRQYYARSDWDNVIALAENAPRSILRSTEVVQMLALALSRRGKSGDQDRAIALIKQQIAETGGDGDSFGTLGTLYKRRSVEAEVRGDTAEVAESLERAILYFRSGFDKDPKNYYLGMSIVTLLLERADSNSWNDLRKIIPRVRAAIEEKLDVERPDFWAIQSALVLATIERDWSRAEGLAVMAREQKPSEWMLATTLDQIVKLSEKFADAGDKDRVKKVVRELQP